MTETDHTGEHIQIGALAQATGLTVRTLHHYDAVGLLVPDERSATRRRLYSEQDVRRLYQIVALRRLGLSLDEIEVTLADNADLIDTVGRHRARVEQSLELQRRLHHTLTMVLEQFERTPEPSLERFLDAIEVMSMIEKHYTPEQQDQLEQRRHELGDQGMRQAELDWAALIDAVKAERANGTEPTATRMLELARQWRALIEQFTGGDEGIRRSLGSMYREQGSKAASRGMVDPELMQYVGQALAALPDPE